MATATPTSRSTRIRRSRLPSSTFRTDDYAARARADRQGEVTVGFPAGAIAAIAREQQADLIVMATHGHGGISRLLLGSTATSTLRQTTVPLLLTRPAALRHADAADEASTTDTSFTAPITIEEQPVPTIDVALRPARS